MSDAQPEFHPSVFGGRGQWKVLEALVPEATILLCLYLKVEQD